MQKVLWTLCVDNYAPEITSLTFPLLRRWANKIDADFRQITERKFHNWPRDYEKLQLYTLGRGNDWNIYIDADALVHPDMFDLTEVLHKDTVAHHGKDFANTRFKYDEYFRRDQRAIGSCNWFAVASDWCLDLWHPIEDLTPEQAIARIDTNESEKRGTTARGHLITDYACSRNIARYGLKFITVEAIYERLFGDTYKVVENGVVRQATHFWHVYNKPVAEKVVALRGILDQWGV